ncbi:hypothetical protein [Natrinema salsiterrestre]|uniref:Uncharacterized protein n=1 Tax=Natrinema salsiterrestre TaxID=2950540 RepID=A0A9Q4L0B3_9EURY|nr:hypothetical protein [Natrinema salsiterrestre]MDF9745222.1 hypothetical protein [Natrinema salsiterrestre]
MSRDSCHGDRPSDSSSNCSLCSLPAPRSITDPALEGTFCCQGCLTVARTLENGVRSSSASRTEKGRRGDGRDAVESPLAVGAWAAWMREPWRIASLGFGGVLLILAVVVP